MRSYIPIASYMLMAIAIRRKWPDGFVFILLKFIGALIGVMLFALALYAVVRLLGGRPGLGATLGAFGYAVFWPSVVGAAASVMHPLSSGELVNLPLSMRTVAVWWWFYRTIVFLRGWHSLSWPRAIAAPLSVFFGLGIFVAFLRALVL